MQWKDFRPAVRHLAPRELSRVRQAFDLGAKMHGDQKRKSGELYFTHPITVAERLAAMGADPDTIIAALLHDTVEDTPLTLPEIKEQFGETVHTLIEGVTKLTRADMEGPNVDEQIETLRKIFTLMQKDVRIMVIKLVDRQHNMETAQFLSPQRQSELATETLEAYVKIADRLCMQDLRDDLEAECLKILEPDMYERLDELRRGNREMADRVILEIDRRLQAYFSRSSLSAEAIPERKSWQNLREQLQTEGAVVTGVSALTAVFLCDTVDSCYRTLGALHQMWKRETMSFQDFINTPAINGYRGLHTTVILEDGTRVRCKIRTRKMHDYARKGVTTLCFRADASELHAWLPWTEKISSLTEDTQGRSKEFFDSLQSDILGQSIMIYGPADQAMLVPVGSTALDGVFHLYGSDSLRLTSIRIAGKEVALDAPLQHGTSLNVSIGEKQTVKREWLHKTRSGYATALIRAALVEGKTAEEKIPLGKELLQRMLIARKRGFLEEFNESELQNAIGELGYASLEQAYIALADGRLETEQLYEVFFHRKAGKPTAGRRHRTVIRCRINMNDPTMMERLAAAQQEAGDVSAWKQIRRKRPALDQAVIRGDFTSAKLQVLLNHLKQAGATKIKAHVRKKREIILLTTVILLWSLNPVAATWFLRGGMTPLGMMTIRFLTFFVYTVIFFSVWRVWTWKRYSPVRNLFSLAFLPTLGNAGMSLYYFALAIVPPSVHLTLLRFNSLLLYILHTADKRRLRLYILLFILLFSVTCVLFLLTLGVVYAAGLAISACTMMFYTLYSLSTERTLQHHKIDVRYPYVLLHIGLLSGVAGVLLIPWQHSSALWNASTLPVVGYLLLCVCLTHTCYSALLNTTRFKQFTDLLLLEVPLAAILESLLLGIILPWPAYATIVIVLGLLLALKYASGRIKPTDVQKRGSLLEIA
jgi:GTP diphosphokinase / guanosine-3',5'-bis(diphosphate) 3'-diphosphatase